jgi:hypothetical protein
LAVRKRANHGKRRNADERMTEQKPSQNRKTRLPCLWAEEEGFEIVPKPVPAKERPSLGPDTAFLLKPDSSPRPGQFPAA